MRMLRPWERCLSSAVSIAILAALLGVLLLGCALISRLTGWPSIGRDRAVAFYGLVLFSGGLSVAFGLERFLPRSGLLPPRE